MEIVKELNLNGNPQCVTNGSLIFAKNIKLSVDGTYITGDDNFAIAINNTLDEELKIDVPYTQVSTITGNIIGVINCPNELVILTDFIDAKNHSKIYRLIEYKTSNAVRCYEVFTSWMYSGGYITGTYIYNVKGELIISIAESGKDLNIPLYVINLNTAFEEDTINNYKLLPKYYNFQKRCTISETANGIKIPCGLYYIYIQYKFSNIEYSNWQYIGNIYAIGYNKRSIIYHSYNDFTIDSKGNIEREPDTATRTIAIGTINKNTITGKGYRININLQNITEKDINFRIGYIAQVDGSIIGRIINTEYKLENSTSSILNIYFTPNDAYETNIDVFTKPMFNLFNVKTLSNFNSKLYVANYNETNYNETLEDYTKEIKLNTEKVYVDYKDNTKGYLLPEESYKIYIHYVREDGTYTNGYYISELTTTSVRNNDNGPAANKLCLYNIVVENKPTLPNGYIDYFLSYKRKGTFICCGVITDIISGGTRTSTSGVILKASEAELGLVPIENATKIRVLGRLEKINSYYNYKDINYNFSQTIVDYSINSVEPVLSGAAPTSTINPDNDQSRVGKHGGIFCMLNKYDNLEEDYIYFVEVVNENAVYHDDSELIYMFSPKVTVDKHLLIKKNITNANTKNKKYAINITEDNLVTNIYNGTIQKLPDDGENTKDGKNYAFMLEYLKISEFNLDALSFKKEPEYINAYTEVQASKNNEVIYKSYIVRPENISDLLEFKSDYIEKNYNSLEIYDSNKKDLYISKSTIRSSNVIRDESLENSWKKFDAEDYYTINKSYGDIVKITNIESNLAIHTKNNLLIAYNNSKLVANNTEIGLENHEIFDIAPTPIFSSDLGYGGLKYEGCALYCMYGYIWYDTDHYKLLQYDNNKIKDLSIGIEEVLNKYKFEKCCINVDYKNNRIIFCFDTNFTISYSTLTEKFISILDYRFSFSAHTTNSTYTIINNYDNIFVYTDTLQNDRRYLPGGGTSKIGFSDNDTTLFKKYASYGDYCCFDIIFNHSYNVPKTLDSIRWTHEIIQEDIIDSIYPAKFKYLNSIVNRQKDLENLYILIYSDAVDTGMLALYNSNIKLNSTTSVNSTYNNTMNADSYKFPYYDKGVWTYNYFRNKIANYNDTNKNVTKTLNTKTTINELNELFTYLGITDSNTKERMIKELNTYEDRNGNLVYYFASDLQSLVYGKYFVIRFIYFGKNKLKFDNLDINIRQY